MNMEQKVKERVVGAAVLMAVAVIFIPMILSGPAEDGAATLPERPPPKREDRPRGSADGFSSRIVPLDGRGASEPGSAAGTSPAARPEPEKSAPVVQPPAPKPRAEAPPAPAVTPPARTSARAPEPPPSPPRRLAAGEGWMVQLGSFANPRNAYALRDRLKRKGYAAIAVSSGSGKDAVTRVYVGPEADRDKAESHVARLLDETRLKGIVVRNPGR